MFKITSFWIIAFVTRWNVFYNKLKTKLETKKRVIKRCRKFTIDNNGGLPPPLALTKLILYNSATALKEILNLICLFVPRMTQWVCSIRALRFFGTSAKSALFYFSIMLQPTKMCYRSFSLFPVYKCSIMNILSNDRNIKFCYRVYFTLRKINKNRKVIFHPIYWVTA